jgi:hypothetical protein
MSKEAKEIVKDIMLDVVKAIIKEDKYRILSPEQIKELAIEVLTNVLADLKLNS